MAPGGTPPGWYPDPLQQAPFRWWDGTAWTPHAWQAPAFPDEDEPARKARIAVLAAAGAGVLGSFGAHAGLVQLIDQLRDGRSFSVLDLDLGGLYLLSSWLPSIVQTVAGVLFLFWFYRSATVAARLGLPAKRDPTAGVVGFVVPVINLWWPCRSVRDLFPPDDPNRRHVLRWFLLWIVGGYVGAVVTYVAAFLGGTVGWLLLVLPAALLVLAALAAYQVITDVIETHARLRGSQPYGSNR
ncbi:MAG: DUF4328 domain-containing protein [Acidimicrobiales bacterium]